MKNSIKIVLLSLLFLACNPKIASSDIAKINGYWEIEKVVLANGTEKEYTINDTYDFFEIKNNSGFRKKVMPQIDGTFLTNDASEEVNVLFEKDKTYLNYSTSFAKWKEELLSLSDTEMVLLTTDNNAYHYKKSGPLNLSGDGKKNQ